MSEASEIQEVAAKFEAWMGTLTERERSILTALVKLATEDEVEGYWLEPVAEGGGTASTQRPSGLGAGGEFTLGGGPGGGLQQVLNQITSTFNLVDRTNDAVRYLQGT